MPVRFAASILLLLLSASSARASTEVTFLGGRTLVVESIEIKNGQATLTLPGGGTMTLEATRIASTATLTEPSPVVDLPAAREAREPAVELPEPTPAVATGRAEAASIPPGPADFTRLIEEAARRNEVDPELLRCLIVVESALDPNAVSPKGAQGLAQLMPATARELHVADPFDPVQAVDAAARRLHELLERSGGRFVTALAAYNAGSGAVARYGGVPPYRETIAYVERILTLYAAK